MRRKLSEALKPAFLSVVNEVNLLCHCTGMPPCASGLVLLITHHLNVLVSQSHKHAGHSGNPSGAPDAETHFRFRKFLAVRVCMLHAQLSFPRMCALHHAFNADNK